MSQRGRGWDGAGNKCVNLQSLASASHWPNPTGSQGNRRSGDAVTENTEGRRGSGQGRHMENNQLRSLVSPMTGESERPGPSGIQAVKFPARLMITAVITKKVTLP